MLAPPRRRPLRAVFVAWILLLSACAGSDGAAEDESAAPSQDGSAAASTAEGGEVDTAMFEGQTIRFVVPFSPGGGYDAYARLVAPFLEEQLGATVIVENQDGAGGLLAINNLLNADPDGTTFAIMNGVGAGGASIAGAPGAQFELDELSQIALLGASPHILATGNDSDYASFDDVLAADNFRFGSTGPGAADYVNPNVLMEVFGINGEIITGFEGSDENELAVTRGDVDGMTGDFDSRLPAVESGDHRALLVFSEEPVEDLPDVPAVMEQEFPNDEAREIMETTLSLLAYGRPVVGPPGMDPAALEALRAAFDRMAEDPELLAAAEEQGRPLTYLTGPETEALVEELLQAPPAFTELMTRAYEGA